MSEAQGGCWVQGWDKRSLRLNLSPPPSPALHTQEAAPTPSGPFLLSFAHWKNSEPAPGTGCQKNVRPRELPGPFSLPLPRTGKASRFLQRSLATPGCVMGLRGVEGTLASSVPSQSRQGGPVPTRPPPGSVQGYFAHSTDEETEVLKVSQDAQGCWAK